MTSSLRWRISLLIAAAIAISYFDRQTLPVAIKAIQSDIPISNTQFSQLQAAFLFAYALMYAGGGKLIDLLGTRQGFLLIMIWWSAACASHGLAARFRDARREPLPSGDGGRRRFPRSHQGRSRVVSGPRALHCDGDHQRRHIRRGRDRSAANRAGPRDDELAMGVLPFRHHRTDLGSMVGPRVFCAGQPSVPGKRGARDLAEVLKPRAVTEPEISWLGLFRYPQVWGLVTAKFLSDAAWYFYLFWLPKYLYDVRQFDTKQVGYYAWIPYAAAGIGSLCGGWFSSRLIQSGRSLDFSRKMALGASAAVMPWIFLVTQSPVQLALLLFSIAFAGQQSWSTLVMILPADIFPHRAVGSVAGLVGFGGAMGGVVFGLVVGYLLDHGFGYGVVFGLVSTFHVLAFGVILSAVRVVRPVAALAGSR